MSDNLQSSKFPSKEEKKRSKNSKKENNKKRHRSSGHESTSTADKQPQHRGQDSEQSKRYKVEEKAVPSSSVTTSCIKQLPIKHDPTLVNSTQLRVYVSDSSPDSDPIVISFPAGLPSSITSSTTNKTSSSTAAVASRSVVRLDDEDDDNRHQGSSAKPPVFTWAKVRASSSKGRIIHGTDDVCTYVSSNEGRGYDGRLTKFYVGVYHKPTSSLKLIPASEKGTVFAMGQSVTNYSDSKSTVDFRNLSVAERRRMVFESFGSQKKKKVMRSQQANVVEMKSVVGAGEGMMKALGKQMEDNKMSESNLKVMEELKNQKDNGNGEKVSLTSVAQIEMYS